MATIRQLKIKPLPLAAASVLLLASFSTLALHGRASAAPFTQAYMRLDRLKFSQTNVGGRICAKTGTTATEGKVVVTFPTNSGTDYTLTAANLLATGVTDAANGITAWPSIQTTAPTVAGKTVTWTSGDLVTNTLYCFAFSGGVGTPSTSTETAVGSIQTQTGASAVIDTTLISESIISDDQIVIQNGTVPPSFSLALSANTDAFTSNLSTAAGAPGVVSTGGVRATITTNAASGWILWAKDLNNDAGSTGKGSLLSTIASYRLSGSVAPGSAARALSGGSEDYGLGAQIFADGAGGGTVSLHANYNSAASTVKVGTLDPINFQPIASANGTASLDKIDIFMRATINGQTPAAGDYTDTITIVGAGVF